MEKTSLPIRFIGIAALIQGILLTLIYRSVENEMWPGSDPVWLAAITTFTLALPFLLFMTITKDNIVSALRYMLPISIVLAAIGAYAGLQLVPQERIDDDLSIALFIFTTQIAIFKALMYVQHFLNKQAISYHNLFKFSWRNFITYGECLLFTVIFWGILHLGAGLFSILGIDIFSELLSKDWVIIPTLSVAFGLAVAIFRNITHTTDNIATILQTLIKFLLPVLSIVSLSFLVTLPFTGLDKLWKTGSGSLLLMWLQALTLFFLNSVYKDDPNNRPYHLVLHRLIYLSILALPVYSVIVSYGLSLRIEQYGLTVSRCWAVIICVLLSCFAIGYTLSIFRQFDAWIHGVHKVNSIMGVVVMLSMLLVNTPLLNLQAISANNLIDRYVATTHVNEFQWTELDIRYFESYLGRQGYLALQALKNDIKDTDPTLLARIEQAYQPKVTKDDTFTQVDFEQNLTLWPNADAIPQTLINALFKEETKNEWHNAYANQYFLLAIDLNNDGLPELISITQTDYSAFAEMWQQNPADNKWSSTSMHSSQLQRDIPIGRLVQQNAIQVTQPQWHDLHIGPLTFQVEPTPINQSKISEDNTEDSKD